MQSQILGRAPQVYQILAVSVLTIPTLSWVEQQSRIRPRRTVPVRLTERYRPQSRQESDNLESCGMLFFSSLTPLGMPKKNGIPKSLLADIKSVKTRLSGLERPKAILSDIGSLKSRLANLEKAHASIKQPGQDWQSPSQQY